MQNDDPIAFFFTWSTYGTWLPGDGRGWVEYRHGLQLPDPVRELEAKAKMTDDACRLMPEQREKVHAQIAETCGCKKWELYAVNCRSNHVHAVISASNAPKLMREQLKAWCTRRLRSHELESTPPNKIRDKWWADRGSIRWIFDDNGLEAAVIYVLDGQDNPRRFIKG